MPHKLDKTEQLILESILNGNLNVSDQYLDEIFNTDPKYKMTQQASQAMLEKLKETSRIRKDLLEKLNNPDLLNHFGDFISVFVQVNNISYSELGRQSRFTESELIKFINNRVDILSIPIEKISSLIKLLRIQWISAKNLIYNSYKLYKLTPPAAKAYARYDHKVKEFYVKDRSIASGKDELLLKQKLHRDDDVKINSYLDKLKKFVIS